MLVWVPLLVFGSVCAALIVFGLRRQSGFLEYPFLAGCGLMGVLFTQAVGVVASPGLVPERGLIKALLMCSLCAAAVHLGWHHPCPASWARPAREFYSPDVLYRIGLVCLVIGIAGFVKLTGLSGGVVGHYSVRGNYALQWRGLPVAYSFFSAFLHPGYVLTAAAALKMRSRIKLLPAAIPVLIDLASIVLLGRRSVLIELLVSTGCILYFARRITIPRTAALCIAPVLVLAMFLAPRYRTYSQLGADHTRIRDIRVDDTWRDVTSGALSEFWSMAYLIDICDEQHLFQFGVGFYNRMVLMFVPKLIVGEDVKSALLIETRFAGRTENSYGWRIPYGMVPTGPFTAFEQFWYFGCLCFYALSRALKYVWVKAVFLNDSWAQVIYAVSVTASVGAVTNDMYAIYPVLFTFVLPASLALRFMAAVRPIHHQVRPAIQPLRGAVRAKQESNV